MWCGAGYSWWCPHAVLHPPHCCSGIDFIKGFDEQIAKLRAFLRQHGLTEGMDPGVCADAGSTRHRLLLLLLLLHA